MNPTQELFTTFTTEKLVTLLDNKLLNSDQEVAARRVLKDRLEGLDEVVKSEALHEKIVSA
jgi:hypothetical protein